VKGLTVRQFIDGAWENVRGIPDIDEFKGTITVRVYRLGTAETAAEPAYARSTGVATPVAAPPPATNSAKFAVFVTELGSIWGKVTDISGAPIVGALVEVSYKETGQWVAETTTNQEGRYEILDLPPDTYTITVSKSGYPTCTKDVELEAGERIEVNFQMEGYEFEFEIYNYPNPVNPVDGVEVTHDGIRTDGTIIRYTLKTHVEDAALRIYDLRGELVWEADLEAEVGPDYRDTGPHYLGWSCTNTNGETVASGIYIMVFVADGKTTTKKIAVIK
jgi:hypothetical protein